MNKKILVIVVLIIAAVATVIGIDKGKVERLQEEINTTQNIKGVVEDKDETHLLVNANGQKFFLNWDKNKSLSYKVDVGDEVVFVCDKPLSSDVVYLNNLFSIDTDRERKIDAEILNTYKYGTVYESDEDSLTVKFNDRDSLFRFPCDERFNPGDYVQVCFVGDYEAIEIHGVPVVTKVKKGEIRDEYDGYKKITFNGYVAEIGEKITVIHAKTGERVILNTDENTKWLSSKKALGVGSRVVITAYDFIDSDMTVVDVVSVKLKTSSKRVFYEEIVLLGEVGEVLSNGSFMLKVDKKNVMVLPDDKTKYFDANFQLANYDVKPGAIVEVRFPYINKDGEELYLIPSAVYQRTDLHPEAKDLSYGVYE